MLIHSLLVDCGVGLSCRSTAMSSPSNLFKGVMSLDKTAFSFSTGLRSAILVMLPVGHRICNKLPRGGLRWAGGCLSNQHRGAAIHSAFMDTPGGMFYRVSGVGTWNPRRNDWFSCPCFNRYRCIRPGLGSDSIQMGSARDFYCHFVRRRSGLPGGSVSTAFERSYPSLLGAVFALAGVELHRLIVSRKKSSDKTNRISTRSPVNPTTPRSEVILNAAALGIASAIGFGIALALGLPRDFWVVVIIILTFRPTLSLTLTFTSMMVIDTLVGTAIGAAVVLEISNLYVLLKCCLFFHS